MKSKQRRHEVKLSGKKMPESLSHVDETEEDEEEFDINVIIHALLLVAAAIAVILFTYGLVLLVLLLPKDDPLESPEIMVHEQPKRIK